MSWGDFSGLYYGVTANFLPDGSPSTDVMIDGLPGSFDFSNARRFLNFTVSRSRFHYKTLFEVKSNTPGMFGIVYPYETYCK